MEETVEYRLNSLETVLAQFIFSTNRIIHRLDRDAELMKENTERFRDEMRIFKDEIREDTSKLKDEMKDFKDEMKDFKDEMKAEHRKMNKQWAEVTNKLGSFAEDIAYPNTKRIAEEQFGITSELEFEGQRIMRHNAQDYAQRFEFDGILVYPEMVFLVESKFTVRMEYLTDMTRVVERFRLAFPEYNDRPVAPVFTSMAIKPDQVKYLTGIGVYAMALGDETMELLNFDELQAKQ
jgi:hypothetical protein